MNVQPLSQSTSIGDLQGFGESELVIDHLGCPAAVPAGFEAASNVLLKPGFEHTPSSHVSVQVVPLEYREAKAGIDNYRRKWTTAFTGEFLVGASGKPADLRDALVDLDDCVAEAREAGLLPPADETLGHARRLLEQLYAIRRCRFEVYPLHDGEVAIDAPGPDGRSVVVVCEAQGGVLCSVNLDGRHRRAVYDRDSAAVLPDGFVREALIALDA